MKAWLKGGIIGGVFGLVLFFPVRLYLSMGGIEPPIILNLAYFIIMGFIISSIIGFVIGKLKSSKNEETQNIQEKYKLKWWIWIVVILLILFMVELFFFLF